MKIIRKIKLRYRIAVLKVRLFVREYTHWDEDLTTGVLSPYQATNNMTDIIGEQIKIQREQEKAINDINSQLNLEITS